MISLISVDASQRLGTERRKNKKVNSSTMIFNNDFNRTNYRGQAQAGLDLLSK